MRIGSLISDWRHINRLGIRVVASDIGISASTLGRIERGEEFDSKTMRKLLLWIFEETTQSGEER